MTTAEIITAINAYAESQKSRGGGNAYLALVHGSSGGPEADEARALRDAGRDALAIIQGWPTLEQREAGASVLAAPDGSRVLHYYERYNGRRIQRAQHLP
jgi:hypothetical protein